MSYVHRITEAANALQLAHRELSLEIADYPTPVAGCDAQFNALLSDRARIAGALHALDEHPFIPTPRAPEPTRGEVR